MNKYHARKLEVNGEKFDSHAEYKRYCELQLLERAGHISSLARQVPLPLIISGKPIKIRSKGFPNGRACKYTADFVYFENGQKIYEDYKGRDTEASRLRRAVVEAIYGVEIRLS